MSAVPSISQRSYATYGPTAPAAAWMNPEVQQNRRQGFLEDGGWRVIFQKLSYGEITGYLLAKDGSNGQTAEITATRILDLKSYIGGVACLMPEREPSSLLASGQWHDYEGSGAVKDVIGNHVYIMEELDTMIEAQ